MLTIAENNVRAVKSPKFTIGAKLAKQRTRRPNIRAMVVRTIGLPEISIVSRIAVGVDV